MIKALLAERRVQIQQPIWVFLMKLENYLHALPESNARGYKVGRFSFNVAEGRCFECHGDGVIKVAMHFLPEVTMACKACNGTRYNSETLSNYV